MAGRIESANPQRAHPIGNGDSLLAAQVTARIHTALQVKLPLSILFDAPTIAALAERVRAGRGTRPAGVAAVAANGEAEEGEI